MNIEQPDTKILRLEVNVYWLRKTEAAKDQDSHKPRTNMELVLARRCELVSLNVTSLILYL